MKFVELPPLMRELLAPRPRSILDPWPAIERLDRELESIEILEQPTKESDRIFPVVTRAYLSGETGRIERGPDGSLPPVLVVRFPVVVADAEEWSRQCKAWREAHPMIETPQTVDETPSSRAPVGGIHVLLAAPLHRK